MEIREQEERLKERVYTHFDKKLAETSKSAEQAARYARSGAYEEQDRFIAASQANKASKTNYDLRKEYLAIYQSPYFAHMGLLNEDGQIEDVLLSDSPDLDHFIDVGRGAYLVPFKQSSDRPMLTAIFHQYQNCKAETFTVKHRAGPNMRQTEEKFTVDLIRNVEIKQRNLLGVTQLLPHVEADTLASLPGIDELLARKLEENRSNAKLRNIIATLQREQFDIIRYDIGKSFVVQGCAGSGKTQCLIHRLFFLRDSVGEMGWDKVLLITPTKLFRKYSMDLMRRYHLTGVTNCSLSNFYVTLLQAYDPRFKNRQYEFELTEEYLPDQYLSQVYNKENIETIRREINRAIHEHIEEACRLLKVEYPAEPITAELIAEMAKQVEARIVEFDETAAQYEQNPDYKENLNRLDALDKRRASLQKRLASLEDARRDLEAKKEQFDAFKFEIERADEELATWKSTAAKETEKRQQHYKQLLQKYESIQNPTVEQKRAYVADVVASMEVWEPSGRKFRLDKENADFLQQICELARSDLASFLGGQTEKAWLHRQADKESNNTHQAETIMAELEDISVEEELINEWLQNYTQQGSNIETQRNTYRAALERSRYFLGRVESSVFEREVWNALEPLKTACNVVTVKTEQLENGHERQTRILYKSDLLFYLMVYETLHGNKNVPDYRFICIDEGQDLHAADYQMIHTLYPNAVLNVFGDTAQVLHEACGISNWTEESGIATVFELNNNYRNAPEIVNFCNYKYGSNMVAFGRNNPDNSPKEMSNPRRIRKLIETEKPVIIVKSKEEYEQFCAVLELDKEQTEFLDMSADQETAGKLHFYSIFAAKGLEFPKVLVFTVNMSRNQKTVACTRALESLCTVGKGVMRTEIE